MKVLAFFFAVVAVSSASKVLILGLEDVGEHDNVCAGQTVGAILVDKESCDSYIECSATGPVSVLCPVGEAFNDKTNLCEDEINVKCARRSSSCCGQSGCRQRCRPTCCRPQRCSCSTSIRTCTCRTRTCACRRPRPQPCCKCCSRRSCSCRTTVKCCVSTVSIGGSSSSGGWGGSSSSGGWGGSSSSGGCGSSGCGGSSSSGGCGSSGCGGSSSSGGSNGGGSSSSGGSSGGGSSSSGGSSGGGSSSSSRW